MSILIIAEEDEAKKADIKRKIMEMQQERLKQKQQALTPVNTSTPTTVTSSATKQTEQQGRGFKLVLSKGYLKILFSKC